MAYLYLETRCVLPYNHPNNALNRGQKCYVSIVEHLNFADAPCLKLAVSKGLGIGLVVGGSIMKLPQLLLITSSRSAAGLSLPAYIFEALSIGITAVYSL